MFFPSDNQSIQISLLGDNSLKIEGLESMAYIDSLTISPWSKGVDWQVDDLFMEIDHISSIPIKLDDLLADPFGRIWVSEIPANILRLLTVFRTGFYSYIFSLLHLISQNEGAKDLFTSNPNLFGLLLFVARKEKWSSQKIARLAKQKQKEILKVCDLPPQKSTLKLVKRIHFQSFSVKKFNNLISLLNSSNSRALSHLEYIDDQLIEFALRYPELLEHGLISKRFFRNHYSRANRPVIKLISDFLDDEFYSDISQFRRLVRCCELHSKDELCSFMTRVERTTIADLDRKLNLRLRDNPIYYHTPPIRGDTRIKPITNSRMLFFEAINQKNCSMNYHGLILRRKKYLYKMYSPERATIALDTTDYKRLTVEEVSLKYNKPVSNLTQQAVREWFDANARRN